MARYELQFWVSDTTHDQRNVPANVTVTVTSVSRDVIACAVPVTLTTHSSRDLILPNQVITNSGRNTRLRRGVGRMGL